MIPIPHKITNIFMMESPVMGSNSMISLIDVITFVDFNVMVNGNSIGNRIRRKITASMMLKKSVRNQIWLFFLVSAR